MSAQKSKESGTRQTHLYFNYQCLSHSITSTVLAKIYLTLPVLLFLLRVFKLALKIDSFNKI